MAPINIFTVPRDARETRDRLIRAGEHLFARQGVDGARTADIRKAAGQHNESALHYHFGSRQGLLVAIFRKHLAGTEPARRAALEALTGDGVGELVAALVVPDAACLHTADGRDYLRIIVQVAGRAGVQQGPAQLPVEDSALAEVLRRLEAWLAERLPETLARERVAAAIGFLTIALADRARRLEEDRDAVLVDHDTFTAELVAMLSGALSATPPGGLRARERP
jgi:AcrR family transcriptional regulator